MSEIRPLCAADIPSVASLFQRIFMRRSGAAPETLGAYLKSLFLDHPDYDPNIASQVYARGDGTLAGFIGVLPLPLSFDGTTRRGAICGSLMVDGHAEDPTAGARLIRAFLSGPQDISLSETANQTSEAMWRKLRGTILPAYSLEWVRVFRPAGFLVEGLAHKLAPARVLAPLAAPVDHLVRRCTRQADAGRGGFVDAEIDDAGLLELVPRFASAFAVHPLWTRAGLQRVLDDSAQKSRYGRLVRRVVSTRRGEPVGAFIYHGRPGRIGHVLQVLAAPERSGTVIDQLFEHASSSGIVALRGRSQPALLEAMLTRKCFFVHRASTVVHARDKALIEPFLAGRAFFNGLAGEQWTRLIGHSFE